MNNDIRKLLAFQQKRLKKEADQLTPSFLTGRSDTTLQPKGQTALKQPQRTERPIAQGSLFKQDKIHRNLHTYYSLNPHLDPNQNPNRKAKK